MDYVKQWNQNRVDWLYRLARSPALDAPAVRIGMLFATFLQPDEREEVSPGYDWLMEHGRMSRATLSKALKQLETAGFIHIERMHRYRNHYSMTFDGQARWTLEPLSSEIERH